MFHVGEGHLYHNAWWLDPILLGHYPEQGLALYGEDAPDVQGGDMDGVAQPIDFLGANIYTGGRVAAGPEGSPICLPRSTNVVVTPMEWDVLPDALEWGPRFLWERYRIPIVITETGMAAREWVGLDGAVHDGTRIDFTRRHLIALHRAIDSDVPVRGYFHWSIMDNFEWARGFKERFGLIHVDFETQQRTPKDSALWYREVIASSGQSLGDTVA